MKTLTMSLGFNRMIAMALMISFVLWGIGFGLVNHRLDAANLTFVSDTLSDSDLGVVSNHTIDFTTPSGISSGDTVTITFEEEFNLSTSTAVLGLEDFDVATSTHLILDWTCDGGEQWAVATSGQTITFTVCNADGAIPAAGTTTIFIGNHASTTGTGDTQIINAVEGGSYEVNIGGTMTDSAETRIHTIDDVTVTAEVDTIFTFTISGTPQGITVNTSPTTTATTTTSTSIPFGEITPGPTGSLTAAQRLNVGTNARNGFVVTVEANQTLLSSTGADIDTFTNGTDVAVPTAWVGPSGTLGSENTYGHWGVTSEDDLNSNEFVGDLWAGNFVNNPRQVFHHDGPSNGTTNNIGSTTVAYQVEIMSLQEAATDYTATLTYVATPTF